MAEAAQIDGHLALRIAPDFVVSGTDLVLSPPSDHVSVAGWSFSVIPPGHFSVDATAYLSGPLFAQRLQATVQLAITLGIISLPPIDISFLNADPGTLPMDTAARVRPSAVAAEHRADFRWHLGIMLVGFGGLLGVMAHGFHWL